MILTRKGEFLYPPTTLVNVFNFKLMEENNEMLRKKLTFSLASLIVLLMLGLCSLVSAQIAQTVNLPAAFDFPAPATGADDPAAGIIPAGEFVVFGRGADAAAAGISGGIYDTIATDQNLQDVETFFSAGGTVQLVITRHATLTEGVRAPVAQDLVISEIMWALDSGQNTKQWIEVYNTTDVAITTAGATSEAGAVTLSLVFTPFTPVGSVETSATTIISDTVTNVGVGGKVDLPGQSGVSVFGEQLNALPQSNLISAYRDIDYAKVEGTHKFNPDNTLDTAANRAEQLKGVENKGFKATPVAGSRNMLRWHIGTPGLKHVSDTDFTFEITRTVVPSNSVVINEIRNSGEPGEDWVELYNAGTAAVGLRDWELSIIKGDDAAKTDVRLVGEDKDDDADETRFPKNEDFKLGAGEYLLITERHPEETSLANGVNVDEVIAGTEVKAGATHQYIVRDKLDLDGVKMLLLRNAVDKNSYHNKDDSGRNYRTSKAPSEKIMDYAGNGFIAVDGPLYNTQVWPFRGWTKPGDTEGIPSGNAFARTRYNADDGHHKDAWDNVGHKGGIGYDPGVDLRDAPGTPGYANNALMTQLVDDKGTRATTDDVVFAGSISISEVMVDAGPRWNLVQWIELYNSSMTEAINLKDWELEIHNATDDVESYVDSSFVFNDAHILPNQTLLLVSGTGTNDVAANRVYNLYQHHRRELGLTNRRSVLLSPEGFYLELTDKNGDFVDDAGNVEIQGRSRIVMWELPARNPDMRQSLVRQYGSRELYDGTPDAADAGTLMESWKQSDLVGAGISFYGHRDDVSTPGYRLGGPLPVSLSKFRPVRNSETGHVDITWITESELNNAGFNILRSETKHGEYQVINVKGIIAGHGTTSEQHVYTFTDTTAKPNVVYYYQIEDVSTNGLRTPLTTTHLRGHVGAAGKLTITWGDLKLQR